MGPTKVIPKDGGSLRGQNRETGSRRPSDPKGAGGLLRLNITLPCRWLIKPEILGFLMANQCIASVEHGTRRWKIRRSSCPDVPIAGGWEFGMTRLRWNQTVSGVSNAGMNLTPGWK